MTTKSYALHSKFTWGLFTLAMPAFIVFMGILFVYSSLSHPQGGGPPLPFAIFWLSLVGWSWYRMLQMPYRIMTRENGQIEFVSLARRKVLWPRDILSIKPKRFQTGFLVVRHSGGSFYLLNQFSGFHEFLADLRTANPAVELVGC